MLLSTSTLPKNAVSVLPRGTTKLLPRYIGPYTVVEEVGDLNYRLALPPYMKTHPVFYVGRLKRYVDPEEITYPHHPNASDGVDHASNGDDAEVKGKGKSNNSQQENPPPCSARDLVNEEDCVVDARPSSQLVPKCRDDVSVGHNLDATSCGRLSTARSVSQLDSRVQSRDLRQQRSAPASAKSKRGPRKGVRSQNTYRAPPALTDAAGNQRLVVGRLVAHRRHQRKNQILVHWRGHPQSFDSWEPVDVLRVMYLDWCLLTSMNTRSNRSARSNRTSGSSVARRRWRYSTHHPLRTLIREVHSLRPLFVNLRVRSNMS